MAAYAQPGAKRQKVRERVDNVDYFQGIDKIEYSSTATHTDTCTYRYYNASERVHSRPMEDWLKFSVSLTDFRNAGTDFFSKPTRQWDDNTHTLENYKRSVKALFDFMTKLGIKYWTAFDTDLVPLVDNWDENRAQWDEMVEFIADLGQKYHVKLLWLAPDLHSHPRYTTGSFTSHDATTFVHAATQIKKCLEVSQRLSADSFVLWPYREGYSAWFQSDIGREIKLFAKVMKMAAEFKERLNFRCQLLIMPYKTHSSTQMTTEHKINRYMWDVTSCLYFLKHYNLERYYKVVCPPGHHMFMANVYNMLGGVVIFNDFNHFDNKKLTMMMKCIVDQNTTPPAGINLRLRPRRDADNRECVTAYIKYIDAAARGLRVACAMVAEQVCSKHLQQRYASYYSGFGSRLVSGDVSLEECEECLKKSPNASEVPCAKSDHLDIVFQRYLDACDHV